MNLDELLAVQKLRPSAGRPAASSQHNAQEFQSEVLEKLAETEALARSLAESWKAELTALKEQNKAPKFDLRSLVAMAAIALSIAGYVIQDARNSSRQDSEIEAAKNRLSNLEKIAATNTEARVRSEVELSELRQGQLEIKQLLLQHETSTRSILRSR